ncbi:ADP-ribosyltransferase [Winogradskyella sp. 3972H.M.0a.05]|uniref:ADP-ribosyltransferase n=1 Tax=Winogradskyella sp. 3972H.M.0a.05 TaxID=2950277 RepID=UPI0033971105
MRGKKFHKVSALGEESYGDTGTHYASRLGIPFHISQDDYENTYISNVPINVKKLIKDLRRNHFENHKFDAKNYIDHGAIERAIEESAKAREKRENKKLEELIGQKIDKTLVDKSRLQPKLKTEYKPFTDQEAESISYSLLSSSLSLNTTVGYIDNDVNKNEHNVHIDVSGNSISYDYCIYYKSSEQSNGRNKAILINTSSPETLFFFVEKAYGDIEADKLRKEIYDVLVEKLEKAKSIETIVFLHENLPHYIRYAYDVDENTGEKPYKLPDELLWKNFMFFVNFDRGSDASYYILYIMTLMTPKYCLKKLKEDQSLVVKIYDGLDDRNAFDRLVGNYKYSKTFDIGEKTLEISNKDVFVTLLNSYIQLHENDSSVAVFEPSGAHFHQGHVIKGHSFNGRDSDIKYWLESDTERDKIYIKNRKRGKIGRGLTFTNHGTSTIYDYVNIYFEGYYNPLDIVKFTQYNDKGEAITMNVPIILIYHADYVEDWKRIYEGIRFGTNVLMIVVGVATLHTGLGSLMLYATITEIGLASADIVIQSEKDSPYFKKGPGKEFLDSWNKIYDVGTIATGAPVFIKAAATYGPKLINSGADLLQVTGKTITNPQTYKKVKDLTEKAIRSLEIPNFNKTGLKILKVGFTSIPELAGAGAKRLQKLGVVFVKGGENTIAAIYKGVPIAVGRAIEVAEQLGIALKLNGKKLISYLQDLLDVCILTFRNKKFLDTVIYVTKNRVLKNVLSIYEEAIIMFYTTSAYSDLNKALRGIINLKTEYKSFERLLNKALDKLPNSIYNSAEHTLYRSVEMSEELIQSLFIGKTEYIEKAFLSTAYDWNKFLNNWFQWYPNHNVIFKIQGKNGKLIDAISDIEGEAEVLFKSNTKFDILNVEKIKNPLDNTKEVYEIILKEK